MTAQTSELIELKKHAASLGLSFSPNIGIDTLRTRIKEALVEKGELPPMEDPRVQQAAREFSQTSTVLTGESVEVTTSQDTIAAPPVTPMTEEEVRAAIEASETPDQRRHRLHQEQMKLIRVVVHCNNDQKSELTGETIKVANRIIGSFTKFIPFDNDEGYHIPQIMLDTLNDKVCQKWKTTKLVSGETVKMPFMTKEYSITVLPELTEEDLEKLAADQKARGAID